MVFFEGLGCGESKCDVKGPKDGDDAPGGFVGYDGVGKKDSPSCDSDVSSCGAAFYEVWDGCEDSNEGRWFVLGHEPEPVVVEWPNIELWFLVVLVSNFSPF